MDNEYENNNVSRLYVENSINILERLDRSISLDRSPKILKG
jgi:hypothetical protein